MSDNLKKLLFVTGAIGGLMSAVAVSLYTKFTGKAI